ncbi:MAG: 3-oxoacyl-ACP synthase [Wenyingzhuangia sp.]|jgi:hypothetical protein|uniref:3-oxoacyl-ACP synthase n=1 Tax=Wenyingzhuangia sp. TaxID=1964193 RepID=UPI00321C037E
MNELKEFLLRKCNQVIDEKLESIQQGIRSYQLDLVTETKSSAGDKHETGRAMLQLEMEKLGQQYQEVLAQKDTLLKIDISLKTKIQLGSLVCANGVFYFLGTSLGKIKIKEETIMVISIHSPIGRLLLGKQNEDSFLFNQKNIQIEQVF